MNIKDKLADYGEYHQNPKNIITHLVGIPLIVFALMLWLSWPVIGMPQTWIMPLSLPITLALIGYYATDCWRSAAISSMYLLPMLLIAYLLHTVQIIHPAWIATICFILGWALQLIGHLFEKQQPAFVDNLSHLFIGPLFIILETQDKIKQRFQH